LFVESNHLFIDSRYFLYLSHVIYWLEPTLLLTRAICSLTPAIFVYWFKLFIASHFIDSNNLFINSTHFIYWLESFYLLTSHSIYRLLVSKFMTTPNWRREHVGRATAATHQKKTIAWIILSLTLAKTQKSLGVQLSGLIFSQNNKLIILSWPSTAEYRMMKLKKNNKLISERRGMCRDREGAQYCCRTPTTLEEIWATPYESCGVKDWYMNPGSHVGNGQRDTKLCCRSAATWAISWSQYTPRRALISLLFWLK